MVLRSLQGPNIKIEEIQKELKSLGFYSGIIDGLEHSNRELRAAITSFGHTFKLPVNDVATILHSIKIAKNYCEQATKLNRLGYDINIADVNGANGHVSDTSGKFHNVRIQFEKVHALVGLTAQEVNAWIDRAIITQDRQNSLARLGYYQGQINGIEDEPTKVALEAFVEDHVKDQGMLMPAVFNGDKGIKFSLDKAISVKQNQEKLIKLGYYYGKADGIVNDTTKEAVCAFKKTHPTYSHLVIGTSQLDKELAHAISAREAAHKFIEKHKLNSYEHESEQLTTDELCHSAW